MSSPFLDSVKNTKTASPLAEKDESKSIFAPSALDASPVYAPQVVRPVPALPPMTQEEINKVGVDAGVKIRTLTSDVMKHQRARDGGIMDEMINDVIKQAKGLDVNSIKQSGGIGKLVKKVLGWKHDMFAQFDSANDRINQLVKQMEQEVQKERDGMVNLTHLEKAIAEYTLSIDRDLQLLTATYEKELALFNQMPEDNVEERQAARDLLDMLERKITDLKGLRLLCIQLGPRVQNMKKTGEMLIQVAQNIVNMVIPAYAANFMLYIEEERQKRSAASKNAVYDTFNELTKVGSEMSKNNQIEAAKLLNRQAIDIDTLRIQQENLFKTLEETSRINREARAARIEYINEVTQLEENFIQKVKESVK